MHGFGGSPRHCVEAKPWAASSARLDQGLRGAGREDRPGMNERLRRDPRAEKMRSRRS
jgi:hypothetical protein